MRAAKATVVVLFAWFSACATPPREDAPVRALRYRQFVSDGAMDFTHGGGQWLDCLFFPDAGVVCTFAWDRPEAPSMHARRTTLDAELAARPNSPVGNQPPEDVRVSAAFAREAIGLADLTDQLRSLGDRLGAAGVAESVARPPLPRDFAGLPAK